MLFQGIVLPEGYATPTHYGLPVALPVDLLNYDMLRKDGLIKD